MNKELNQTQKTYVDAVMNYYQGERTTMVDYYAKNETAYQIGNYIIAMDKSSITTDFCFGYGYCGVSDSEDEKRASDMVNVANTRQDYFLSKNLENYDREIKTIKLIIARLTDKLDYNKISYDEQRLSQERYFFTNSWLEKVNSNIKDIDISNMYDDNYKHLQETKQEFTLDDYKVYEQVLETEKAKFVKRLNTYLKRYGLSKVNSWSYLVD